MNRIAVSILSLCVVVSSLVGYAVADEPKEEGMHVLKISAAGGWRRPEIRLDGPQGRITSTRIVLKEKGESPIEITPCDEGVQVRVSGHIFRAKELEISTKMGGFTIDSLQNHPEGKQLGVTANAPATFAHPVPYYFQPRALPPGIKEVRVFPTFGKTDTALLKELAAKVSLLQDQVFALKKQIKESKK